MDVYDPRRSDPSLKQGRMPGSHVDHQCKDRLSHDSFAVTVYVPDLKELNGRCILRTIHELDVNSFSFSLIAFEDHTRHVLP